MAVTLVGLAASAIAWNAARLRVAFAVERLVREGRHECAHGTDFDPLPEPIEDPTIAARRDTDDLGADRISTAEPISTEDGPASAVAVQPPAPPDPSCAANPAPSDVALERPAVNFGEPRTAPRSFPLKFSVTPFIVSFRRFPPCSGSVWSCPAELRRMIREGAELEPRHLERYRDDERTVGRTTVSDLVRAELERTQR